MLAAAAIRALLHIAYSAFLGDLIIRPTSDAGIPSSVFDREANPRTGAITRPADVPSTAWGSASLPVRRALQAPYDSRRPQRAHQRRTPPTKEQREGQSL